VANRLRRHFIGDDSRQVVNHRLYISRRKATLRRIVNESEIIPILEAHGFETVLCEDLSLAEQIGLFAKTTAVIGAHGAGLTNLIYCDPGSCVGEINTGRVFSHYLVMARQLDMHFSGFEADPVPAGGSQIDMHVNPPAFRKWISDCLGTACKTATGPSETSREVDVATQTPDSK
jgi:capsular polysaccharide biosynthesis protein